MFIAHDEGLLDGSLAIGGLCKAYMLETNHLKIPSEVEKPRLQPGNIPESHIATVPGSSNGL